LSSPADLNPRPVPRSIGVAGGRCFPRPEAAIPHNRAMVQVSDSPARRQGEVGRRQCAQGPETWRCRPSALANGQRGTCIPPTPVYL